MNPPLAGSERGELRRATSPGGAPVDRRFRRRFASVLAVVLLAAGCSPSDIDRTYGKRRGTPGGSSVNGTSVLAGMFEASGYRVTTWRRLSPKLEECDVIVWAPDNFQPPTKEQREFLESWLWRKNGRRLVYIGRDYDAAIAYWKQVVPRSRPEQTVEMSRRLAKVQAAHDAERAAMPKEAQNDWFVLSRDGPRRRVEHLEGPWSTRVDAAKTDIEIAARLAIPVVKEAASSAAAGPVQPRFESLLRSGEDTLVTRVAVSDWGQSQILVVVNGSFLLNLPLVNHEHRKLAGKLIAECGPARKVVFLESDADGPRIFDKEPGANAPTGFEILTLWPIGVIVLHLIVLGITACFAAFPVFGRPRHPPETSLSDFGRHVEALGELLESTRDQNYAVERMRHYREHVKRDSERQREKQRPT